MQNEFENTVYEINLEAVHMLRFGRNWLSGWHHANIERERERKRGRGRGRGRGKERERETDSEKARENEKERERAREREGKRVCGRERERERESAREARKTLCLPAARMCDGRQRRCCSPSSQPPGRQQGVSPPSLYGEQER